MELFCFDSGIDSFSKLKSEISFSPNAIAENISATIKLAKLLLNKNRIK